MLMHFGNRYEHSHRRRLKALGLTMYTGWTRMHLHEEVPFRGVEFADGKMRRILVSAVSEPMRQIMSENYD